MSGKAFVDSNVLVYAHDKLAGEKFRRSRELLETLWNDKRGVLSSQVLQEFCVNARRKAKNPIGWDELRDAIRDFSNWEVVLNNANSVLRALELERRSQLSFWDAMIVQAAESAECAVLYSEDLSDGQKYGGVLVVNPFRN
jgi:predicted nucleic acid-binding protein